VDWQRERLTLEAGETKNREGRFFPFTGSLREILEEQITATKNLEKEKGIWIEWLFHDPEGNPLVMPTRRGTVKTTKYFREVWATACKASGLAGRIPHDFRRSTARRLRQEGYDTQIAMKLLGHKTESIYRRYDIISDEEITAEVFKRDSRKTGKVKRK
jgi:integrase